MWRQSARTSTLIGPPTVPDFRHLAASVSSGGTLSRFYNEPKGTIVTTPGVRDNPATEVEPALDIAIPRHRLEYARATVVVRDESGDEIWSHDIEPSSPTLLRVEMKGPGRYRVDYEITTIHGLDLADGYEARLDLNPSTEGYRSVVLGSAPG